MSRALRLLVLAGLLLGAGCSLLDIPLLSTPTPVPVIQATVTPQPIFTQTAPPPTKARILRVWLPPRFDPNAGTASAEKLSQRFADFQAQHPGLRLEIRIKAEGGETGLLNSLAVTSLAAPSAMPDLVALPRSVLESAASTGFLHPTDGLSVLLDNPDWYPYARDLGHIQNIGYGLPFAGDALVLARRSDAEGVITWQDMFVSGKTLAFPANDPQGLFGLLLYASSGGEFVSDGGLPSLDQDVLVGVLSWVRDGTSSGVLSPTLNNITTVDEAIKAYTSGSVDMAVSWFSNSPSETITVIPGLSGLDHSFATGWVWALAGSNPENQQPAMQLAEYLVADDFIGLWMGTTDYLPVRPYSGMDENPAVLAVIESAQVIPSEKILQVLGPYMHEALIRVLNGEQPEVVAGSVIEKLKQDNR